jgi:Family of unknown function (DUF5343)
MADQEQDAGGNGVSPYIAFQSMKTFIQNLKPHKLPNRIDRSLLQNFAGSVQGLLITTLRFFDLIDAKGIPTESLERLHQAYDTDQWPVVLGDLLRKGYPAIFEIGLATASPGQFSEAFRNAFGGAEAVQRKSRTFFLNAARDAQIEISQHITKNKKPRSMPASGRRRAAKPNTVRTAAATPSTEPPAVNTNGLDGATTPRAPNAYQLLAVFDPSDMSPDEQAAVWTLIQYLKRKEVGAPAVGRQRRDVSRSRPAAASTPEAKEGPDGTALAE